MNELIEKLAKESGYKHPEAVGVCEDYAYFSHEKFAELIVAECVEVCAGIAAVRAGYNDADGRDTAYSCGDTIKEHFGVE